MNWKLNRINVGKPYEVTETGPHKLPQVTDRLGTVAITDHGKVFCRSETQAKRLCALANAGRLQVA